MYRLLPVLQGEDRLNTVSKVLSGNSRACPGSVSSGCPRIHNELPMLTSVACYETIQQPMGDVLQNMSAPEFYVDLGVLDDDDRGRLSIFDDGAVGEGN